jgi:undecaprenyl phosphate N,N'-diacetylbacillosamine 1-phosphate transferase
MNPIALSKKDSFVALEKKSTAYILYVKPLIDFLAAITIMITLFPVLFLCGMVIKFDSRGPVVFKQPRIGKDGKKFYIFKFRTMYTDVPAQGLSPDSTNDPRITRAGKVLRKTSLDELPQIFNIIKGEMSFVGPRPEQEIIVNRYYTDFEKQRFLVKPGITGLWQISMDRTKPIHENMQYDLEYIKDVSIILDLKTILKTISVMFKSNTY